MSGLGVAFCNRNMGASFEQVERDSPTDPLAASGYDTYTPLQDHAMIRYRRIGRVIHLVTVLLLGALAGACDLLDGDDHSGAHRDSVLLVFRIEAAQPPDGGWAYWYVKEGVLFQRGAEGGLGPFGATVDCGSHAGIYAVVTADPSHMVLVIETVEDELEDSVVARKEVSGAGEHQMIVLTGCP